MCFLRFLFLFFLSSFFFSLLTVSFCSRRPTSFQRIDWIHFSLLLFIFFFFDRSAARLGESRSYVIMRSRTTATTRHVQLQSDCLAVLWVRNYFPTSSSLFFSSSLRAGVVVGDSSSIFYFLFSVSRSQCPFLLLLFLCATSGRRSTLYQVSVHMCKKFFFRCCMCVCVGSLFLSIKTVCIKISK